MWPLTLNKNDNPSDERWQPYQGSDPDFCLTFNIFCGDKQARIESADLFVVSAEECATSTTGGRVWRSGNLGGAIESGKSWLECG
ncbi:hypothetical protein SH668x_001043 [Planctomicrobium sp. SH668]|uniref:hypothetical protein n=1 Tax=Planctomicrobium sp. SH668 TaxID=3448126 RepID=UPI003F5AFD96